MTDDSKLVSIILPLSEWITWYTNLDQAHCCFQGQSDMKRVLQNAIQKELFEQYYKSDS